MTSRKYEEDFSQLQRYKDELMNVPEGLTRDEIYEALTARIPYLERHDATPRVMNESGVDLLLDQLITLQHNEAFDLLLEEQ